MLGYRLHYRNLEPVINMLSQGTRKMGMLERRISQSDKSVKELALHCGIAVDDLTILLFPDAVFEHDICSKIPNGAAA